MNSSVLNYDIQVDSCAGLSSGDKNLFTAKTFTYETSSAYETSEMQYVNSSFVKAKYLVSGSHRWRFGTMTERTIPTAKSDRR